jgi:arginyl-tRNA synthetase
MNLAQIQESLRNLVRQLALDSFGIELEQIAIEYPPKTELGDLAFPAAFELAKKIKQVTGEKKNPREIAETLQSAVEREESVEKVEVAGAGYLNIFLNRAKFLSANAAAEPLPLRDQSKDPASPKVCVEHTSVNPNKAAHIGHVRNSVLGDTFVRILQSTGKRVEVQNYIDNTGVQVADVVVGFIYLEGMDLPTINSLDSNLAAQGKSFDYYCWDLYARVGQAYQLDESLKEKRAGVLHLIEEGNNETAKLADYVASRNVECILTTMERFSIQYDLLPRESEILHLHFWNKAFEQMKQLGVVRFEEEGNHAGCWVMPFESHSGTDEHEADKILVRSNGTVTYTGKDIAYQMWKLGLLGLDFYYRPFHKYADGKQVWITTADKSEASNDMPKFGGGETVYNVIDTRQSYPQEIVKKGVAAISPERGEKASVHLSYEMVALSPAAAEELGFELSEDDRKRPFIEMSGRKGLGVKADDLIDRLEANALVEVEARHPDSSDEEKRFVAHQIAVGALRYFLLKFTRTTVIVFDFKEALSFDGETGCFCQYSAVRANSIFRKLEEKGEIPESFRKIITGSDASFDLFDANSANEIWALAVQASRLADTVRQSAEQNEPAILAKYAFNLAKAFNLFYHHHKIISEENKIKRAILVVVADMTRRSLTAALETMGIEVPEKM